LLVDQRGGGILFNGTSLIYYDVKTIKILVKVRPELPTHPYSSSLVIVPFKYCHSPTQPQLELELDLMMGRKPPPTHHPGTQEKWKTT
jgi:hypothetical protein